MADSDVRIAAASEVPPSTLSRWIAATAWVWSELGRSVVRAPLWKATTPVSTLLGWASTNATAAFFAASSRVGATSVAPMLFETSIATITVPAARVTGTDAAGPAKATASAASPSRLSQSPSESRRRRESVATPADTSAARRRREARTAPAASAATMRAPRTSHPGEAMLMPAASGCSRRPRPAP